MLISMFSNKQGAYTKQLLLTVLQVLSQLEKKKKKRTTRSVNTGYSAT